MNAFLFGTVVILSATAEPSINQILDGIRMVESSNLPNPKDGDNGLAIGPYQIHKSYWKDGTRLLKVNWPYSEARQESKARQVVKAYITSYGKGHGWEGMIRCHNGGPTGWKKKATLGYLAKVKAAMKVK